MSIVAIHSLIDTISDAPRNPGSILGGLSTDPNKFCPKYRLVIFFFFAGGGGGGGVGTPFSNPLDTIIFNAIQIIGHCNKTFPQ